MAIEVTVKVSGKYSEGYSGDRKFVLELTREGNNDNSALYSAEIQALAAAIAQDLADQFAATTRQLEPHYPFKF